MKSRIVRYASVDPKSLTPNPANWRGHPGRQARALTEIVDRVGFLRPVVVNETTGHVVDGHLRVSSAVAAGAAEIPVVYVNLTIAEERAILTAFDPVGHLADVDDAALAMLSERFGDEILDLFGAVDASAIGNPTPETGPGDDAPQTDFDGGGEKNEIDDEIRAIVLRFTIRERAEFDALFERSGYASATDAVLAAIRLAK